MHRPPTIRTAVAAMVVMAAVAIPASARADNTDHCRDEPGDVTEQGQPVLVSGSEVAFVGVDASYQGGVLVCASADSTSTNVGVVTWPEPDVVRNCRDDNPPTDGSCQTGIVPGTTPGSPTAAWAVVNGVVHFNQPLDFVPTGPHQFVGEMLVQTVGVVDDVVTVGSTSGCLVEGETSPNETVLAGDGGGSWECVFGPMDGMDGEFFYARAGLSAQVVFSGDVVGTVHCSVASASPPVFEVDFVCQGPLTGA